MAGMIERRLLTALECDETFFNTTNKAIQAQAADKLRTIAINLLKHSPDENALGYRGNENIDPQLAIAQQANSGDWADEAPLIAFAEYLGCHAVVQVVNQGQPSPPHEKYTAKLAGERDDTAPTLYLTNSPGHWSQKDNVTEGRGDCLFNAIAQELLRIVQEERAANQQNLHVSADPLEAQNVSTIESTPTVAITSSDTSRISQNDDNQPTTCSSVYLEKVTSLLAENLLVNSLPAQSNPSSDPIDTWKTYLQAEIIKTTPPADTMVSALPSSHTIPAAPDRDYHLALQLQLEEIEFFKQQ